MDDGIEVGGSVGPQGVSGNLKGKRTAELITVFLLVTTSILGYAYYKHDQTTELATKEITQAMKELAKEQKEATIALTKASQEAVTAQREMTCILSLPVDRREAEFNAPYGFCKRLTQR